MTESSGRRIAESALRLGLVALIGTLLLAGVADLTREPILDQQRRAELRILEEVLPRGNYDNDLLQDMTLMTDPSGLGGNGPQKIFRGRLQGRPAVAAMHVTSPAGYNGDIELIVGIDHDGVLTGVRTLQHRETPGLGDGIDADVSDWILQFEGLSIGDPPLEAWEVKRDGGEFDQFTGATITARAVVRAIRDAQQFFLAHRDEIFDRPPVMPEDSGGDRSGSD